jgi:hypothetical protein
MPNHCCNVLIVTSPNNIIEQIRNFYVDNFKDKSLHLSFEKNVPIPEDKKEDWYNWNCQNWGTKWDAYDIDIDDNDDNFTYYFNTAWSPPLAWLEKIAAKYPNLELNLEYNEPGCDFGGVINYKNGEVIQDESYNLSEHNWEKVDKKLLENVINEYLNSTEYDSETQMSDIVDIIYENYSEKDNYYFNIHTYIDQEINRIIEDKLNKHVNLEYNDKGNTVNNLKI